MPIPITAQSGGRASIRIPPSLRSSSQMSFGHLIRHSTGASASQASQTASGTASGSSSVAEVEVAEDRRVEQRLPGGALQTRPRRPRPADLLVGGDDRAARRALDRQLAGALVGRVGRLEVVVRRRRTRSRRRLELELVAGADLEDLGGAAAVDRDRHPPRGVLVEEEAPPRGRRRRRGPGAPSAGSPREATETRAGARQRVAPQLGQGEVERDVAESVDPVGVGDRPSAARAVGREAAWRSSESGSIGSPPRPAPAPSARWAATGAKTSRPWKVADGDSSRERGGRQMSTASAGPPSPSIAGGQQAVVGADEEMALLGGADRDRRAASPPTPGSTIARWTPTGA